LNANAAWTTRIVIRPSAQKVSGAINAKGGTDTGVGRPVKNTQ